MMLTQAEARDLTIPYRMSQLEVLVGFVRGVPPQPLGPLPPVGPTPRAALEELLAEELAQPPCLLSFSGGRDSSALLATALDVARRRELPEPVAFTLRYPGDTNAEETNWQELVIDHLRPETWEVIEIEPGAAEFLGPAGTASLRANGLLWPPALHVQTAWLDRVHGATLVTGEGGDEILDDHRATSLRTFLAALRQPRRDQRPTLHRLARDVAPARIRVASARRRMAKTGYLTWLGPRSTTKHWTRWPA
jgi:asparagine synthetase B (glutamine-hydrolysing)